MRILFTGGSSFTGYWFIRELSAAGHQVVATFQRGQDDYAGMRSTRVGNLLSTVEPVWYCSFGDKRFMELVHSYDSWDLLCHHAADVTDYKSQEFDVVSALASNTQSVGQVFSEMSVRGCKGIVLTGSVFEPGEGAGSERLPAFSPYGLSKMLTWQVFHYHSQQVSMPIGKFVIPNPFGPLEEPRFTAYLMNTWKKGEVASVNTPDYVRDNIHVSLLAQAYRKFAERSPLSSMEKLSPSEYVESQGQFARRLADQMRKRSTMKCSLSLAEQTEFKEPRIRINIDPPDLGDWSESSAWDDFYAYYSKEGS